MSARRVRGGVLVVVLALVAGTGWAKPAAAWRITINHSAEAAGALTFEITPTGGAAIQISVLVENGRGENGIARDLTAAFEAGLDAEVFEVERDNWEDVVIKRRRGQPDFDLTLVCASVPGLRILLDRE